MNRTTAHLPLLTLAADVARLLPSRADRPWTATEEPCLSMDGYPVALLSDGARTLVLGGDPSRVLALARPGHSDSQTVLPGPAAARDLADLAARDHLAAIEREAAQHLGPLDRVRDLLLLLRTEVIRRAGRRSMVGGSLHCPGLGHRIGWQRRDRSQVAVTTTAPGRAELVLSDLPLPLVERVVLLVMGRQRRTWHRMPAEAVPSAAARRVLAAFPRLQPLPALSGGSFRLIWSGGPAPRTRLTVRVPHGMRGTDASTADLSLGGGGDLVLRVLDALG
ncbi:MULTISPECIES: hypothetical protein [Streptacidiphilus]|uniref:Uncharacterized protein n=1 Tax=Streptacidiphilus cavernicola TaxID=3342716 RepID=A0ABV6UWN8_9ACTN|nr:hypothetical protein [Streptacidiphilus jeojiense]